MINVIFDAVSNFGVSLGSLLSTEHPVRRSSPEYLRYFLASCRLLVMSVTVDSNNYRPVTRDEFRTQDPLSMFLLPMEIPYIVLRSVSATHVFTDVAYIQFQMSKSASSICSCGCYLFFVRICFQSEITQLKVRPPQIRLCQVRYQRGILRDHWRRP
jgi:hypothetical protein